MDRHKEENVNVPYIEAIVVAGDEASHFVSEKIMVQGAKEGLSFNMVLQIPKIPTKLLSSESNSLAHSYISSLSLSLSLTHTHTYIHTYMHTYIHTKMYLLTIAYLLTCS